MEAKFNLKSAGYKSKKGLALLIFVSSSPSCPGNCSMFSSLWPEILAIQMPNTRENEVETGKGFPLLRLRYT